MSAIETFSFGEYTMRPAGADDLQIARVWNALDRWHRDCIKPEFWIEQKLRRDSFLMLDRLGPLLFFKMHGHGPKNDWRSDRVQIFIQFPPAPPFGLERKNHFYRVGSGVEKGFAWLERILIANGVEELFFDSESVSLVLFCTRNLGFNRDGHRLSKILIPDREPRAEQREIAHVRAD